VYSQHQISLTNPIHYTALSDLADTYNIDLFALTETWISPNTTSAELFDATPPGFSLISNPRPVSASKISSIVGGGTAFLIRQPYSLLSSPSYSFSSFEISNVTLKLPKGKLSVFNIYRPPTSLSKSQNKSSFLTFLKTFNPLSLMLLLFLMTLSSLVTSIFMLMTSLILILSSSCLFSVLLI
jgi:hypothetical protein